MGPVSVGLVLQHLAASIGAECNTCTVLELSTSTELLQCVADVY